MRWRPAACSRAGRPARSWTRRPSASCSSPRWCRACCWPPCSASPPGIARAATTLLVCVRAAPRVLLRAAAMSAMILYLLATAAVFSWLLTSEQIPQSMAEWMTAQGFGVVAFLLVTNIVLLAAGNFMDPAAIVLIMAPILFPIAARLGVHPVHLGILMAVYM